MKKCHSSVKNHCQFQKIHKFHHFLSPPKSVFANMSFMTYSSQLTAAVVPNLSAHQTHWKVVSFPRATELKSPETGLQK